MEKQKYEKTADLPEDFGCLNLNLKHTGTVFALPRSRHARTVLMCGKLQITAHKVTAGRLPGAPQGKLPGQLSELEAAFPTQTHEGAEWNRLRCH